MYKSYEFLNANVAKFGGRILSFFHRLAIVTFFLGIILLESVRAQLETSVISEIRIRGNEITEESLIRFSCGLKEGQRLLPEGPGRAIRNLYQLGLFSDIQIFIERAFEEGIVLEIVVDEYPKLGAVNFKGNKAIKSKKLRKELGFIQGQFITPQEVKRSINRVWKLYQKEGYLLAQVDADLGALNDGVRVPLIFNISEGKKINLKRIRFIGNKIFTNRQLRKQMKETKQDGWWFGRGKYNEKNYPSDKQKILDYYYRNGFRDAEIIRDSLYYDGEKKNLYLDIKVNEGLLYTFGKITWDGNKQIQDRLMAELVVAEKGNVYNSERIDKSHEQISSAYGEIGYIGVGVSRQETLGEDSKVNVHFQITENKPWKIRQVRIAGNTKTKDRVIRRELRIRPGDTFRRSFVERSVREVQQLNFFNSVDVGLEPDEESLEIDLTLKVEEKSTGTASVGAGYSERDKLVGTIALQIPNFLGNGQQLDFQWEFGTRRETFRLGFTEPWLLNTPTSLSGSLFRDTQRFFGDFDQRAQGASFRVGRRLNRVDYTSVSLGYGISEVKFINFLDSTTVDSRRQTSLRDNVTSSLNANITRNSRDLPVFATSGSVVSYSPEIAGSIIGGNSDFHKHDIAASFYFPLFWKFALNIRTQIGLVSGYGDSPVPFSELYTPGGVSIFEATMIRGYVDQSIGPKSATGVPLGGVGQMIFNAEITVPFVPNQFYGLIFADAGNAWGDLKEINMFDLRRSVGFGIRIMTPVIGIMGFDFAWGIDRRRVDGIPVKMMTHFQFGPQFY